MIYNHKSKDYTQEWVYSNFDELLTDVCNEISKLRRNEFISVYTNYDLAQEIASSISKVYFCEHEQMYDCDLVILTISSNGFCYIETMYGLSEKCKTSEGVMVFFDEEVCGLKELEHLEKSDESILSFCFDIGIDNLDN